MVSRLTGGPNFRFAAIDYGFHLQIVEMNENVLNELPKVIDTEGITSLKVFMAYKHQFQADDETLFRTLLAAKDLRSTRDGSCGKWGCH